MKRRGRIAISLGTGSVILGLLVVTFVNFFYRSDVVSSTIITQEVKRLADIFQTIHEQCTISGFDNQQNIINFLNVEQFTGSEVGPMNLVRPEKWQGPYVDDNPTIQSKEFMVVKTDSGLFITPGNGVRLPNGKVVGKDIVLSKDADIAAMMQDSNALHFKDKALAQKLTLSSGTLNAALDALRSMGK
jgi:hypothetical protein